MALQVNYEWKSMNQNLKEAVEAGKTEIFSPVFGASPDDITHNWYASLSWNSENLEEFEVFLHLKNAPSQRISAKFSYKVFDKENMLIAEESNDEAYVYEKSEGWGGASPSFIDGCNFNFNSIARIFLEFELFRENAITKIRKSKPNHTSGDRIKHTPSNVEPPKLEDETQSTATTEITKNNLDVVIIDRNVADLKISRENSKLVRRALVFHIFDWVMKNPKKKAPVYKLKENFHNHEVITCDSESSLNFLKEAVLKMDNLWSGANLEIIRSKDLIVVPIFVTIQMSNGGEEADEKFSEMVRIVLEAQNPEFHIHNWKLVRTGRFINDKVILTFSVDEYIIDKLKLKNSRLTLGSSALYTQIGKRRLITDKCDEEERMESLNTGYQPSIKII